MTVVAVVEDDPFILDAVTLLLESRGWNVRAHPSGEAFLDSLGGGAACDCLLLDPHLPGISGAGVARAAVERRIPTLVLTARPCSEVTEEVAAILGAEAVIVKPVRASELIDRIRALLTASVD